ncbi:Hypothetical protein PACV_347 [Pacmanvirus A23]|uniref:Hypothetical protein n=1 Tax=Pacmanvirus A23 TaxID=1932881 RepID=UPI000A09464B|nr:Hypothetical protein B9W72_gp343 [Pacmanvirus A23]SIP86060.1 Hypothetical protein PACV_347 [Pacmanvirus A23]
MSQFKLDVAIEEGDLQTVIQHVDVGYSLYAKQMAIIAGHKNIVDYIKKYSFQRNNSGVVHVHRKYNRTNRKFEWDDVVPEHLRERFLLDLDD